MATVLTGGSLLEAHLRGMAERIKRGNTVSVGFMEEDTYPEEQGGQPVAYIAAIQNFGAPEQGIPPRPFFSNMVKEESPFWGKQLAEILKEERFDGRRTLDRMGGGIADQLKDSIRNTNEPPLSPVTIARKGFATPLIETGFMLQHVNHKVNE